MFSNIFFIRGVCVLFIVGLGIEIIITLNYLSKIKKISQDDNINNSILNKSNVRSQLHFIPTLLTALGILGTFSGIFIGLQGINLNTINSSDSLLENSIELLKGMQTAFATSLWGLGSASLFIFILAISETIRRQARSKYISKIKSTPQHTNDPLLNRLTEIANNTSNLNSFNTKAIGQEVAASITPIFSELSTTIVEQQAHLIQELDRKLMTTIETTREQNREQQKQLIDEIDRKLIRPIAVSLNESNQVNKESSQVLRELENELVGFSSNTQAIGQEVAASITPIFSELSTTIVGQQAHLIEELERKLMTTIETTREQNRKQQKELINEIDRQLIQPVIVSLNESNAVNRESSQAVLELKNELAGFSSSLTTSIQTIEEFQTETLTKLQDFAANLQKILAQFRTDTEDVMRQVAAKINQGVKESIIAMEAQRVAFADSAQQASDTFRGIREDLQEALTSQGEAQAHMLTRVQASTESILEKANQAFVEQSTTLTTVGREASDLMLNANHNLSQTLGNIDTMLQNTRQTVQEELERFRDNYQTSLQDFFEQQNNLLEGTLGQQRNELRDVVRELQKVFREDAQAMAKQVINSMDKIQTTTESVQTLANTIGLTSGERLAQMQEIARTLGSESVKINNAYESLVTRFNQGLDTWNNHLTNYFEQANQTYNQGRQDSDKAVALVCEKLNKTSHGLMGVAEYLVTATKDLNNNGK